MSNAYSRNQKRRKALGIVDIQRLTTVGNTSTWQVKTASKTIMLNTHRLFNETGVLREVSARIDQR